MMAQHAVLSLPERLDWQEKSLAARLDGLRAMKGAHMPLYAAFSDEQKQIAEQLIRGPMGMRMMMGASGTSVAFLSGEREAGAAACMAPPRPVVGRPPVGPCARRCFQSSNVTLPVPRS
jgi:hypothetical protein